LETLVHTILSKDEKGVLNFLKEASEYEAEMILDELTLYLKTLLLERQNVLSPLIIERFFRIIAEAKQLLSLGSDGEFVLSLTLFKMLEAQQLKEIDAMIRTLENELSGIGTSEPSLPTNLSGPEPDVRKSATQEVEEVVTISQEEIEESPVPAVPPASPEPEPALDPQREHRTRFTRLIEKIYDRDYDLGTIFEQNITFVSFENGVLTWESTVEGEEKKTLVNAWGVIKMLVQETFGVDTRIDNIAKKKVIAQPEKESEEHEERTSPVTQSAVHDDADSASMIEEVEVKSSCIAPEAGDTEAAKEKDPSELLEEPMVKAALELLNPKKVRIKRNV
jgi:DNA polymerase-3 subunit gamma/tau